MVGKDTSYHSWFSESGIALCMNRNPTGDFEDGRFKPLVYWMEVE